MNQLHHRWKPRLVSLYTDPELTRTGKERSVRMGKHLLENIQTRWSHKQWKIGASSLIRAQETAYYMLGKRTGKKIVAMPHICEFGEGQDDTPTIDTHTKMKIIENSSPGISKHLVLSNLEKESNLTKSDFYLFQEWAKTEEGREHFGFTSKAEGGDEIYRVVIFTHARLIKRLFPEIPVPENHVYVNNNEAIFCKWDTKKNQENMYNLYDIEYIPIADKMELYSCPNDCRKATLCAFSKNATKKSRRNNRGRTMCYRRG